MQCENFMRKFFHDFLFFSWGKFDNIPLITFIDFRSFWSQEEQLVEEL